MANTNIYAMTDSWNNAAVTFTAIQMNVTDTASQAASLLIDLQVGGASKFNVRKDGTIIIGGDSYISRDSLATFSFGLGPNTRNGALEAGNYYVGNGAQGALSAGGLVVTRSNAAYVGWAATNATAAPDTALSSKAAGVVSVDTNGAGNSLGAFAPQVKAGAFVATDFPVGSWMVGRDTTNLTTKLYYNNAGTLMTVALA